jgi:hypothetical protein
VPPQRLRSVIAAPSLDPVSRCWIIETKRVCGRTRHDYLKGRPADKSPLAATQQSSGTACTFALACNIRSGVSWVVSRTRPASWSLATSVRELCGSAVAERQTVRVDIGAVPARQRAARRDANSSQNTALTQPAPDLQVTRYDERRPSIYTIGMDHALTSATGTAWERTPWRATQRAAWEAFKKSVASG